MLYVTYRVLAEDQFLMWVRTYNTVMENREEEVEKVASSIKQELSLLGAHR